MADTLSPVPVSTARAREFRRTRLRTGVHTYSELRQDGSRRFYADLSRLGGKPHFALHGPGEHLATACRDTAQAALRRELARLRSDGSRHDVRQSLYVAQDRVGGLVKVGVSRKLAARMSGLRRERPGMEFLIIARPEVVRSAFGVSARVVEQWLLRLLHSHRHHGEWVYPAPQVTWVVGKLRDLDVGDREDVAVAAGLPIVSLWLKSLTEWTA